jgi:cytoskeletal protein RodZ
MKNSMYQYRNLMIVFLALGLIGIIAAWLNISISFESTNPETISKVTQNTPSGVTNTENGEETNSNSTPIQPVESSSQKRESTVLSDQVNSDTKTKVPGLLRVSNKTTQPIRLVLLARQLSQKSANANKIKSTPPAHWDFAPEEGSERGLVLSLPQANLRLEKGDILTAFAQDGSRRYWGPYVVGETSSPQWQPQGQEWQLVLQNR